MVTRTDADCQFSPSSHPVPCLGWVHRTRPKLVKLDVDFHLNVQVASSNFQSSCILQIRPQRVAVDLGGRLVAGIVFPDHRPRGTTFAFAFIIYRGNIYRRPGGVHIQIIWPNSLGSFLESMGCNPRHPNQRSKDIWITEEGCVAGSFCRWPE
jgi:hypothetical protein